MTRYSLRTGRAPLARVPMAAAARIVRPRNLGSGRRRPPIQGDYGSGGILLILAALPVLASVVYVMAQLAGAMASVGVQ